MFASRMLLRVPGQALYLNTQMRAFSITRIALEPPRKAAPPPPPAPASKRTTKAAPPPPPEPEPEKPAPRKRLVLSDKERKNRDKDKERKRAAALKERERAKKQKEKEKEKAKEQKLKLKLKEEQEKLKGYPPPPKRPTTAYLLFYMQHRTDHPGGNAAQLATAVSEQWKALSDAERESYSKQANEKQSQYKTEVANWVASLDVAQLHTARYNKEPGTRGPAALGQLPKRPANAYALFFKDFVLRPDVIERVNATASEHADQAPLALTRLKTATKGRLAAEEWNNMSEKDKQVYRVKQDELKQAYNANYGDLIAQQKAARL